MLMGKRVIRFFYKFVNFIIQVFGLFTYLSIFKSANIFLVRAQPTNDILFIPKEKELKFKKLASV